MPALTQSALALEQVHRCGSSYSFQPCDEGGSAVDAADPRSAQQVTQARQVAQRDARLADALVRQRGQAEQAAMRQGPATLGPNRFARTPAPCRARSDCERAPHAKRKHDKGERVTLYRAPATN
ncbi:MAG TPA: hypothetical protein VFK10_13780 [Burkholderiaceae bacterium]|nr:hypothetical protein [Burkholderiaceae bacterium]